MKKESLKDMENIAAVIAMEFKSYRTQIDSIKNFLKVLDFKKISCYTIIKKHSSIKYVEAFYFFEDNSVLILDTSRQDIRIIPPETDEKVSAFQKVLKEDNKAIIYG